jgi:hypothetical protein
MKLVVFVVGLLVSSQSFAQNTISMSYGGGYGGGGYYGGAPSVNQQYMAIYQRMQAEAKARARAHETAERQRAEQAAHAERARVAAIQERARQLEIQRVEIRSTRPGKEIDLIASDPTPIKTTIVSGTLCFTGDTPIAIQKEDGSFGSKPIAEVNPGDLVVSCDLENEACVTRTVTHRIESKTDRLIKIKYDGKTIRTTPNHPFYSVDRKDWVAAESLHVGDSLLSLSWNPVKIESIETEDTETEVYNLDVEGHHNYYACDVLVHNCTIGMFGTSLGIGAYEGASLFSIANLTSAGTTTLLFATITGIVIAREKLITWMRSERAHPDIPPEKIFHRKESPTQTPEVAKKMEESGELWGRAPQKSIFPKVQAYKGPLPAGEKGIEFTTDAPIDDDKHPTYGQWSGNRDGVKTEDSADGEFAKIKIRVLKNTQKGNPEDGK